MALRSGYDIFTPDPGTHDSMICMTCNSKMDVRRNVFGPTGSVEARSGSGHLHDVFTCKNSGRDWHNKVIDLMEEKRKTKSDKISSILQEEIDEVLSSH